MKRLKIEFTEVAFLFVTLVFGVVGVAALHTAKAASVPQYEYAMYLWIPGNNSTPESFNWVERDDSRDPAITSLLAKDSTPNINDVFNLAGANGWHFVSVDDQQFGTLYIFERPIGG